MPQLAALVSNTLLLTFVAGIPAYGAFKKINVFDAFITGAKTGFETIINIMPYLIAMFVGVSMLRASGFFELMAHVLQPVLSLIHFPSDLLPLALIRPFSGSAANGMMADIIHQHGGNAMISNMAATLMGSTETTFYVVAVYFGAVNIRRTRHAIPAGLLADFSGILAAVYVCRYFFG
jgi:spore maturation protein B